MASNVAAVSPGVTGRPSMLPMAILFRLCARRRGPTLLSGDESAACSRVRFAGSSSSSTVREIRTVVSRTACRQMREKRPTEKSEGPVIMRALRRWKLGTGVGI